VHLHALGQFSQEEIGISGILKEFPELVDEKGKLRSFGSVQVLKRHGFEVILCSASRSHGDTFFCPLPSHAANIAGAAKTVKSEKLLGHCVTSWAIRLNDFATQIPYIGLAAYATSRADKSSEELLRNYCRELFGTDPEKFIKAVMLLGISLPFAQSSTTGVQWNGLKDSLPAPKGYLEKLIADLRKNYPARYDSFTRTTAKALAEIPEGIRLLSEFFSEAKRGFDIIDAWLTGARFQLAAALIAEKILKEEKNPDIAGMIEKEKKFYSAYLELRETPLSASKNSGLVYDVIQDYFGDAHQPN
jgi:hypothetical protein